MKSFIIDPKNKTIEPYEYSDDWKDIGPILGCRTFDIAGTDEFSVYVDDEGLYVEDKHFFTIREYPQPLVGKALLLGPVDYDTGETTECTFTLDEVKDRVQFMTVEEVIAMGPMLRE